VEELAAALAPPASRLCSSSITMTCGPLHTTMNTQVNVHLSLDRHSGWQRTWTTYSAAVLHAAWVILVMLTNVRCD